MQKVVSLEKERVWAFGFLITNRMIICPSWQRWKPQSYDLMECKSHAQITATENAKKAEREMVDMQQELKEKTDYIVSIFLCFKNRTKIRFRWKTSIPNWYTKQINSDL